jgi:uncharacterized protein YegP (UPF0339 family)
MSTFFFGQSSKNNKYYFRLKDNNNETILNSNQGYETRSGCLNGIDDVKKYSPFDHNYSRFEGRDNLYYFNLKGRNGEIIGQSEGYNSASGRDRGIENCKREAPFASIKELTSYTV